MTYERSCYQCASFRTADGAVKFGVFVEGAPRDDAHAISTHASGDAAKRAIKRYTAADRRREKDANHVDGIDRDDLGESPDF